jgi:conjugative transfer region protein TrbK
MRRRLLHPPAIARAVGFALVAIAMIAAALHFRTPSSAVGLQGPKPSVAANSLAAELKQCQRVAEEAKDDPACEKAWVENRRRFFTYAPSPTQAQPKTKGR